MKRAFIRIAVIFTALLCFANLSTTANNTSGNFYLDENVEIIKCSNYQTGDRETVTGTECEPSESFYPSTYNINKGDTVYFSIGTDSLSGFVMWDGVGNTFIDVRCAYLLSNQQKVDTTIGIGFLISSNTPFTPDTTTTYYLRTEYCDSVTYDCVTIEVNKGIDIPDYLPEDGLVAWYPFNGNANDESGNGNHGVRYGTELTTDRNGKENSCLSFDGDNDYVEINDNPTLRLNNTDFTFSVWLKFDQINSKQTIISKRENEKGYQLGSDYILTYQALPDNDLGRVMDYPILENKWQHLVMTYSFESGQIHYYVDGQLVSGTRSISSPSNECLAALLLGNDNTGLHAIDGNLDDIGIWNRALSEEEIKNLYDGEKDIEIPDYLPEEGLVAWYPFNGNANDESGNGNHGEVNGATLNYDRNNSANSSYSFPDSADYIRIPYNESQNLSNEITTSLWLKHNDNCSHSSFENQQSVFLRQGDSDRLWLFIHDSKLRVYITNITYSKSIDIDKINEWYNVVFTIRDSIISIYINGQLIQTTIESKSLDCSSADIVLGKGFMYDYCGSIDDMGIWNRALTSDEVQQLYIGEKEIDIPEYIPEAGLVAWYPFNGNANDESGNENHGEVNGASLTSDRSGNTESAYNFRGFGYTDHIKVNHSPSLNNLKSYTYQVYFNPYEGDLMNGNGGQGGGYNETGAIIAREGDAIGTPNGACSQVKVYNDSSFIAFYHYDNVADGRESQNNWKKYSYPIENGKWHQMIIVANEERYKIYLNGELILQNELESDLTIFDNLNLYFGMYGSGAKDPTWYPFYGDIDDIAFWNRELTEKEINQLFENAYTPAPTANTTQSFCSGALLSEIEVEGENIKWYSELTEGTLLSNSTPIENGLTYYASQTINGIESVERIGVQTAVVDYDIESDKNNIEAGENVEIYAVLGDNTFDYPIGSTGQAGGIVFYDKGNNNDGWRYIEVTPSDVGSDQGLGCYCSEVAGTSSAIGAGLINTNQWFNSGCGGYWITLANSYQMNGFSDWFIPSKDELNEIYTNLKLNGFGDFGDVAYWSSTPAAYGTCSFDGGVWSKSFANGDEFSVYRNGHQGAGNLRFTRYFSEESVSPEYLWSTGETTENITVSPETTTTYWVDVTINGFTCRKHLTISVENSPIDGSIPTDGLVAWYPFNGNANDESGNGLHGTVQGAELTIDRYGNPNSAYSFTTDQQIDIPNTGELNLFPITIDLWYNVDSLEGNNGNIFSKYVSAAWNGYIIKINSSDHGIVNYPWYIRSNSDRVLGYYGEEAFEQSNVFLNTWYNIAFTVDETGGKIYINGILVDTHPWTGSAGETTSSFLWKIGGKYTNWFHGQIDDVGIWNRALSNEEIQNLYYPYIVGLPTGESQQPFCEGATISEIQVEGTGIKWYSTETSTSLLSEQTVLQNGQTYYAAQSLNGNESSERFAVTVTVNEIFVSASHESVCGSTDVTLVAESNQGAVNYSVGDIGPAGGYIFYDKGDNADGWRYMEVAPNDLDTFTIFGCYGESLLTSTEIGTGLNNSNIIDECGDDANAAQLCLDYKLNGYSNWFLPSKEEINEIYNSLFFRGIGDFMNDNGSNFTIKKYNRYWTSSTAGQYAWAFDFGDSIKDIPTYNQIVTRDEAGRVRPIRQFASSEITYYWSTGETTATIIPTINQETTFWVDVTTNGITCRKYITIEYGQTPAPSGSPIQPFCDEASILANLVVNGENIQWYSNSTGGNSLPLNTYLGNGLTFYASQTKNGCESEERLAVLTPYQYLSIEASETEICSGSSVQLTANAFADTTDIQGQLDDLVNSGWIYRTALDGHHYLEYPEKMNWNDGKVICEEFGGHLYCVNSERENEFISIQLANLYTIGDFWLGLYQDTNDPSYSEPKGGWKWVDGSPLNYTNWYSPEPNENVANENFVHFDGFQEYNDTWNDISDNKARRVIMEFEGTANYLWSTEESSQTIIPTPETTTEYWVDITANGVTCRAYITIKVINTAAPKGANEQSFCKASTISDLIIEGSEIIWYAGESSLEQLPLSTPLENGTTYYATQTINGCESNDRLGVTVSYYETPAPTGETEQYFCEGENLSSVQLNGENIKWYNQSVGGNEIQSSTILVNDQTYYASQTQNGCESVERIAIYVIVSNPDRPLGLETQTFCNAATIENLQAIGENIQWYSDENNMQRLDNTEAVLSGSYYYASQTINGCESKDRLKVLVLINDPEIIESDNPICSGEAVQITVNSDLNAVYNWSTNETTNQIEVLADETFNYWVDITVSGATCRKSGIIEVINTPPPVGDLVQSFNIGDSVASIIVFGENILWYYEAQEGSSISLSTPLVEEATYYATQTQNGCESLDRFGVTVDIKVDIEELELLGLDYYPNPVRDNLNITSKDIILKVEVYNSLSQLITTENTNEKNVRIKLSSLTKGSYFIKVYSEEKQSIFKILKK